MTTFQSLSNNWLLSADISSYPDEVLLNTQKNLACSCKAEKHNFALIDSRILKWLSSVLAAVASIMPIMLVGIVVVTSVLTYYGDASNVKLDYMTAIAQLPKPGMAIINVANRPYKVGAVPDTKSNKEDEEENHARTAVPKPRPPNAPTLLQ